MDTSQEDITYLTSEELASRFSRNCSILNGETISKISQEMVDRLLDDIYAIQVEMVKRRKP